MYKIRFTSEALSRLTDEQRKTILWNQARSGCNIDVSVDFALPKGYVSVILAFQTSTMYGGISPEGIMST